MDAVLHDTNESEIQRECSEDDTERRKELETSSVLKRWPNTVNIIDPELGMLLALKTVIVISGGMFEMENDWDSVLRAALGVRAAEAAAES